MTTVREICSDALLEIGATDLVDGMKADTAQYMLRLLNRMMAVWNTEELMVYTVNRSTYNLVAGQQEYTFGTGGNFNAPRPVKIQGVSALLNVTSATPLEIPMDIMTDLEWQNLALKQTPSLYPVKVWITGNYPLNSLWFWPKPMDSTVDVVIYSWGKTESFATLEETVVFPNGYEEAIVTNLAIMASSSQGIAPMPSLVQRAMSSRSKIQSMNMDPLYATCDNSLVGGRGRTLAVRTQGTLVD